MLKKYYLGGFFLVPIRVKRYQNTYGFAGVYSINPILTKPIVSSTQRLQNFILLRFGISDLIGDIGEAIRRIFKRIKDNNSRDTKLHLLKYALENNDQHVSEKDFKIIGNGFRGSNKKRKIAEALLIREIKPTLNIQDQLVPLQLFR